MFPETEIIAKQTQDTESELTKRWSESRKLDSGYSQNDPFKQLQLEMREYPRIVPTQTTTRARSFGYIFKISFSEIVTIHQIFQQKMSTQTELETAATRDYRQLPSPKLKVQECLREAASTIARITSSTQKTHHEQGLQTHDPRSPHEQILLMNRNGKQPMRN